MAVTPWDTQFAYVTGKGGVGKTTVSASMARAHGQRGRQVLLASTEPDHYQRLFPNAKWGSDPVPFDSRISLVAMTPEAAFEEYGRLLIKPRLARRALFGNRYAHGFLAAIPGLSQWAILGKAWYHCSEQYAGRPRFDTVILDAPATGHGLQMLRLPQVIADIAPPGPLRRDAQLALEMLRDPARTCITVVSLPEELPTNETLELLEALETSIAIPAGLLVANQVAESCFSKDQRTLLQQLTCPPSDSSLSAALRAAHRRAHRDASQERCLQRLRETGKPMVCLPLAREMAASSPAALSQALSDYFRPTPR